MAVNVSSKFKERLLGSESFATIFTGGRILVYSGTQPTSADDAAIGTLLAQVTNDGVTWAPDGGAGGLNFVLSGVWAANDPAQTWRLLASAAGTAGWFRLCGRSEDDGAMSFNAPRIDGSVGVGGTADLKLPTVAMTVGYTTPVQQFLFSFPPVLGA